MKYYLRRPVSGIRYVHLLHANGSSHTSEIVKQFLKLGKVTVLPYSPYSPDSCHFELIPLNIKENSLQTNISCTYTCMLPTKILLQSIKWFKGSQNSCSRRKSRQIDSYQRDTKLCLLDKLEMHLHIHIDPCLVYTSRILKVITLLL